MTQEYITQGFVQALFKFNPNATVRERKKELGMPDSITLSELLDLYREFVACDHHMKLSSDNYTEYKRWLSKRSIIQNIWRVFFHLMDVPVNRLNNYNVHQYSLAYQRAHSLANSTINRCVTNLRGLLTWGYKNQILKEHRLREYSILPVPSAHNMGVRRTLSAAEIRKLVKVLEKRENDKRNARSHANLIRGKGGEAELPEYPAKGEGFVDYVYPMIMLSLFTGARKGSVRGLRWRDINEKDKCVIYQAENSKTGVTTVVPLVPKIMNILLLWKKQNGISDSQSDMARYVFTGRDGVTPLNASCPRCWYQLLKEAGIEGFRWHDMRHTFATHLVQNGTDIATLKTLMGHSNINTTAIYLHTSVKHMHESVKVLNSVFKLSA